jgi:hypothetical protein
MGKIIYAYDRCVNSSGVLCYILPVGVGFPTDMPCHVMHPWVHISDVIRCLEEAGKISNLAPTTAAAIASPTEGLGLGEILRGVQEPFIRSRHLASREESQEPFVACEESISQVRRTLDGELSPLLFFIYSSNHTLLSLPCFPLPPS